VTPAVMLRSMDALVLREPNNLHRSLLSASDAHTLSDGHCTCSKCTAKAASLATLARRPTQPSRGPSASSRRLCHGCNPGSIMEDEEGPKADYLHVKVPTDVVGNMHA